MDLTDEQWAVITLHIINRFPSSTSIAIEFCNDPQGRQAKAPEQR
jgi:hypothetical protein